MTSPVAIDLVPHAFVAVGSVRDVTGALSSGTAAKSAAPAASGQSALEWLRCVSPRAHVCLHAACAAQGAHTVCEAQLPPAAGSVEAAVVSNHVATVHLTHIVGSMTGFTADSATGCICALRNDAWSPPYNDAPFAKPGSAPPNQVLCAVDALVKEAVCRDVAQRLKSRPGRSLALPCLYSAFQTSRLPHAARWLLTSVVVAVPVTRTPIRESARACLHVIAENLVACALYTDVLLSDRPAPGAGEPVVAAAAATANSGGGVSGVPAPAPAAPGSPSTMSAFTPLKLREGTAQPTWIALTYQTGAVTYIHIPAHATTAASTGNCLLAGPVHAQDGMALAVQAQTLVPVWLPFLRQREQHAAGSSGERHTTQFVVPTLAHNVVMVQTLDDARRRVLQTSALEHGFLTCPTDAYSAAVCAVKWVTGVPAWPDPRLWQASAEGAPVVTPHPAAYAAAQAVQSLLADHGSADAAAALPFDVWQSVQKQHRLCALQTGLQRIARAAAVCAHDPDTRGCDSSVVPTAAVVRGVESECEALALVVWPAPRVRSLSAEATWRLLQALADHPQCAECVVRLDGTDAAFTYVGYYGPVVAVRVSQRSAVTGALEPLEWWCVHVRSTGGALPWHIGWQAVACSAVESSVFASALAVIRMYGIHAVVRQDPLMYCFEAQRLVNQHVPDDVDAFLLLVVAAAAARQSPAVWMYLTGDGTITGMHVLQVALCALCPRDQAAQAACLAHGDSLKATARLYRRLGAAHGCIVYPQLLIRLAGLAAFAPLHTLAASVLPSGAEGCVASARSQGMHPAPTVRTHGFFALAQCQAAHVHNARAWDVHASHMDETIGLSTVDIAAACGQPAVAQALVAAAVPHAWAFASAQALTDRLRAIGFLRTTGAGTVHVPLCKTVLNGGGPGHASQHESQCGWRPASRGVLRSTKRALPEQGVAFLPCAARRTRVRVVYDPPTDTVEPAGAAAGGPSHPRPAADAVLVCTNTETSAAEDAAVDKSVAALIALCVGTHMFADTDTESVEQ